MTEDIINKLKEIGITWTASTPLAPESITIGNVATLKTALKTLCPDYAATIDGLDDTKLLNVATIYQQILAGNSAVSLCTALQAYSNTKTIVETKKYRNYFLKKVK